MIHLWVVASTSSHPGEDIQKQMTCLCQVFNCQTLWMYANKKETFMSICWFKTIGKLLA